MAESNEPEPKRRLLAQSSSTSDTEVLRVCYAVEAQDKAEKAEAEKKARDSAHAEALLSVMSAASSLPEKWHAAVAYVKQHAD